MKINELASVLSLSGFAAAATVGSSGTVVSKDGGFGGVFRVVDDNTLQISSYTLKDGTAPALYFWGSTTSDLSKGFRINNERVSSAASTSELTIKLDAGYDAAKFDYVGLWCERFNANFGQAFLTNNDASTSQADNSASATKTAATAPTGAAAGLRMADGAVTAVILNMVILAANMV